MKNKIIKIFAPISFALPLACSMTATSCGLNKPWDWKLCTNNNTEINYCLLIGQNEHTDSIERTRGARMALDTYDEEATKKVKGNANIAKPKQGHIELTDEATGTKYPFVVNELEQMEQKSIGGASWDPITANATTGTWISKHGNKITLFVSNNDSMAEGAIWASNWIEGLPIFGYDANSTTLQWINSGRITATVDQGPSTQAASAMMLLRNMLEDRDKYWENNFDSSKANNFGLETYNPMHSGFEHKGEQTEEKDPYGYVDLDLISQKRLTAQDKDLLSLSTPIAKLEGTKYNNISDFIKPDGKAKDPKDMFDQFVYIKNDVQPSKHYNICHTYSNRSEAFLIATMRPYFNEYASRLSLDPDIIEGDGTDETLILNQIDARPNKYDGFLICMAKTTSSLQYVLDLAKKAFAYENNLIGSKKSQKLGHTWQWGTEASWTGWDNFEERLDTPLIFWIREPSKDDGSVDYDTLNNKYFKYTYYVGPDSKQAGTAVGNVITTAINKWFNESLRKE